MNPFLRNLLAGCLLGAGCSAYAADGGHFDRVDASLGAGRDFVPNELLVQFRPGASAQAKDRALARIAASRDEVVAAAGRRPDAKGDLELVRYPRGLSVAQAAREVGADPAVEFAEPNWVYTRDATSNDPYFTGGQLWGMYGDASSPANAFGSQAAEAWARGNTCGADVYVGVIDEGLMTSHDDLAANVWTNPFDPVNGVDDDGNGLVDDVNGWDFAGGDNSVFDGTSDDHGTHVSGTIAGAGGNGTGVAGVCWSAKLISAKFLGRRGGTTANAVKSVNYMTDLKLRHGLNIVATNNSWGGGGFSQALKDAIDASGSAQIVFVAAAGNDGSNIDASPSYPAAYTSGNLIAVAAISSSGALASWSNYGATKVHIGAPGVGIYSTLPKSVKGNLTSGYGSYSGTSMATPHVTGAVALYASSHPGASAQQIRAAILAAAVPTASLAGKVSTGGRLDASGF
ncbi:MAG TPA: S8 family peptidase [Usitatibacter sp.]|nr:S8 family peptidase [Usitatibacter sp.]